MSIKTIDTYINVTIARNLNKHRRSCPGRHTAWTSKAPGAVDPSKDTKDHKNHNKELMRDLVQELAAGQVPYSFFEREGLQDVLNKIAPGFDWPRRKKYASTAKDLYYEKKEYSLIILTLSGSHSSAALSAAFWSAIQDKNITRNIFTITADNAASNYGMMGALQKKFSAMGVKWPKSERFHQCACHVLNLMAKDFLEHLGEFTDSDYNFFDRYISTSAAELDDEMIEGCNSFAKDFIDGNSAVNPSFFANDVPRNDISHLGNIISTQFSTSNQDNQCVSPSKPRYRKSLLLQAGISASRVEHAIDKLKSGYSKSICSLSVQHEESFSSQLSHSPQSLSIESQLLNDFQMVEAMPQGSYDGCLPLPEEVDRYLSTSFPYLNGESVVNYWVQQIETGSLPNLGKVAL
ncbi:hypothetical protein PPACK8108_LOCUS25451 [Phakopsora pachyrhizi]|uniref:Uncharacterized protein n=1 Tax=Phakopsora pachyrhizi TaxID=170000 RepID=A0AAV0BTQ7_PHAPC|nr:hypothetical protein PPACK8108_LOCUS25451 [Phakopsora pachyrhizi]